MGRNNAAPAGQQLALGSRTDVGAVRADNEDALAALLPPNAPAGTGGLLVVADGMGGHCAGARASVTAVHEVVAQLRDASASAFDASGAQDTLRAVVKAANKRVFEDAASSGLDGMGTTLTVAVVAGENLSLAHVGDSRAYLLRDGTLAQLTPDHTWVARAVASGAISNAEAAVHPKRNVLTRAVGADPAIEVATAGCRLTTGDVLLLCSDGLHGLVPAPEITAVLSTEKPQAAADELVARANAAGGTDNITALVAHVVSVEAPSRAHEGNGRTAAGAATVLDIGPPGISRRIADAVRRVAGRR